MERALPPEYTEILKVWNRLATRWETVHLILDIVITVSLVFIAFLTTELETWGFKILSFALALSGAAMTAFDIGGRANAFRSAYRLLHEACLAYRGDPRFTYTELWKQYEAGEAVIGNLRGRLPTIPTVRHDEPDPNAA